MGNLVDFAIYNPGILTDSDFLAGFVARHELTENLLGRLREISRKGLAHHHLILGQRGMGKTSLLRRLAVGVTNDPDLASVLVPLTFREEQYNVHNLHVFWCNCLDALGDWFERTGQADKAAEIDQDVATLCKGTPEPEGTEAHDAFKRWAKREGRRPLLLLDNLDLIIGGLSKQDWALRRALQEKGGVVVVGASANYLEETADPTAAFHDFFQVTVLEKLSDTEMTACLRRLADVRGDAGKTVVRVLDEDPGRVRTLYDLTGGSPRTLVLLYLLLESDGGDDVMADLERLLDQVTVFYKARVEDLAPQQRVVLDAVALHWDPATASTVAEVTGLEIQAVSSQLDRLTKAGVVEKVSVSTTVRAAFQVSERLFNIWYLMRHGPRRQHARLRWLTGFLRGFYTPSQLEAKARALLSNGKDERPEQASYYCALADAIDDKRIRNMLLSVARIALERAAASEEKRTDATVDLADVPGPESAAEWLASAVDLRVIGREAESSGALRRVRELDAKFYELAMAVFTRMIYMFNIRPGLLQRIKLSSVAMEAAGDILFSDFGPDTEVFYRDALKEDAGNSSAEASLLMLLLSQPSRKAEVEASLDRVVERCSRIEGALLKAYHAFACDNAGEAVGLLKTILEQPRQELFEAHWNVLLRTLRFAAGRSHGEYVLARMGEMGLSDRLWPLHAAFDAFLHGKERLQDVNPEVRGAAQEILKELAPTKPEGSPAAIGKKGPARRGKARGKQK